MSTRRTPQEVLDAVAVTTRPVRPFDWRRTPGLSSLTALVFLFLYAPLVILVVYAFNASNLTTVWAGFSLRWFQRVAENPQIRDAALNSLIIAVVATLLSTVIATFAALALERGRDFPGRDTVVGLIAMPLVVPEIVVAITTLVFFSAIGLKLGLGNLIIAHTVFCIPFALLPIQARLKDMGDTVEVAARDLYAPEREIFRRITFPLLWPAILSGAMLAFVTSLDDFLISMMVADAGATTLPVYIYGMMRLGVTPEVNAVSALLLLISTVLVTLALVMTRRSGAEPV